DADPHVRWCGRGGVVRLPPIPIPTFCQQVDSTRRRTVCDDRCDIDLVTRLQPRYHIITAVDPLAFDQ
ncbi:MAG: hypothetical protein O2968_19990, partial [Acidobacteria bacterium]|nr:hypothetical protein [Acidobacteriota bacterium]